MILAAGLRTLARKAPSSLRPPCSSTTNSPEIPLMTRLRRHSEKRRSTLERRIFPRAAGSHDCEEHAGAVTFDQSLTVVAIMSQ